MTAPLLRVVEVSARYGPRVAVHGASFDAAPGQCVGVIGPNGVGKTTLLRVIVGLITPSQGEVRIDDSPPRVALRRSGVAYFAGEQTMPGFVRASAWGRLGNGDTVTTDSRRLRALSRGTRQLLGLRTVLGRQPLALVVLDEPWEGLDPDGARWLTAAIALKRDRGAAVVLASHRFDDLAGLCDAYLVMMAQSVVLLKAHEIAPVGPVTATALAEAFDRRSGGVPLPHSFL